MLKERVNKMNDNAYIGRICTDLVLNKKATDDNERQWTRFRLAVPRRFKKEGVKDTDFFNCVAFASGGERISVNTQKKVTHSLCPW